MAYKGYKTANIPWISTVPDTWNVNRGKALFFNPKEINKNGKYNNVLSLTLRGVIRNDIDNPIGLSPKSYDTYQLFEKDDLVFKLIDLENISTSRVGLVGEQGIMSSAYIRTTLREKTEHNIKYFYYQYYSLYLRNIFNGLGAGVRQTLSAGDLLSLKILVPTKEEQDQIVKYLDWKVSEINSFINKCHSQINMLLELKQAQIDEITIHGNNPDIQLRDSGLDWLGNIPSHWNITKIRNNYRLQNGISESGAFFDKGTPFVNYSDVYNNRILPTTFSDVANSNSDQQRVFSVQAGDIFFTRTSETIDDVGIASICLQDVPKAVFSGFLIRARAFTNVLIPEYMSYYLQSQSVRNYFTKEMNIVIRASLGQNLLKSLYIPVPPRKEQRAIVDSLNTMTDRFDKMITSIENEIQLMKELRTKIVADAVTGQIDVRDIVIPEYEIQTEVSYDIESDEENTFSDDLTE